MGGRTQSLKSCFNDNMNKMKGVYLFADYIQIHLDSQTQRYYVDAHFIRILYNTLYYAYPIFVRERMCMS